VIVQDVAHPFADGEEICESVNQIGTDHRLDIRIGVSTHLVKTGARDGVARKSCDGAVMFDAKADARIHGPVIGLMHADRDIADHELCAWGDLLNVDGQWTIGSKIFVWWAWR
jgi:hypothetical protein